MSHRGYPVTKVLRTKKRAFADKLKMEHDKLSTQEKIKKLDIRLGDGVGAKKERARLNAKLEAEKHPQKETKTSKK